MQESVKNGIISALAVLTAILFVASVSSCVEIKSLNRLKNDEVFTRLTCQEEVKSIREGVAQNLKSREKELGDELTAHEATKKALAKEQLVSQGLKDQLQKETRFKEVLEEELENCRKSEK